MGFAFAGETRKASDWNNREVYDLLCKIDRGYEPSEDERAMLETREELILKDKKLIQVPRNIGLLRSLRTLDLSGNQIAELPDSIGQLGKLQSLDLNWNHLSALPESIGQLTSLHKLDLHGTGITALPASIGQLASLQTLDLNSAGITALPESIGQLASLQTLDLGGTGITALPDSIGHLACLQTLSLWNTKIAVLPEAIGQLKSLLVLDLRNRYISRLPDSFSELKKLEILSLGGSKISYLPDYIKGFSSLISLGLSNSSITSLPDWIGELPSLARLNLMGLTIPKIPKSLALRGLPFVEEDLFGYGYTGVNLFGVTLTGQTKSIFLETPELIPSLYEAEEQITLRECRVIFLGDGDSGKSYTIQRFRNEGRKESAANPYCTRETPGVEILDYHADRGEESFDIHFWDFGGQELLHAMHRCFLSEQTCYVVTVKSRETKADRRARYWLRNVTAFAPKSPILLYVNCWDNDSGKRVLDANRLKKDFPMIRDVVYVSAKAAGDGDFRAKFMEPVIDMAADSDGCRMIVNRNWVAVRRAIETESEKKPYLDKARYHELCAANGIENDNAPALLTFFNSLGVCFSYHRDAEKQELADYRLLKPVWLTNALYAVIEEGMDLVDEGKISVRGIQKILCKKHAEDEAGLRRTAPRIVYKKEECPYIIDVAIQHGLCYRIDENTLFFPALCSTDSPEEALEEPEEEQRCVEYRLKYRYLPDSVVHRLMIRCKQRHYDIHCWLRGVILADTDGHRAIVRMDDDDETLIISLRPEPGHAAYSLFLWLRSELLQVNAALGLAAEEIIVDGEDQYPLNTLLSALEENDTVRGNRSGKKRNPGDLLGRFYESEAEVEDGTVRISILPYQYHSRSKDDFDLRVALYDTYKGVCPYCAMPLPNVLDIQVDHILPRNYQPLPEMESYIKYLRAQGFNVDEPDYVENYFPTHPHCNNVKRDHTAASLIFWHMLAAQKAPEVLRRMEARKADSKARRKLTAPEDEA